MSIRQFGSAVPDRSKMVLFRIINFTQAAAVQNTWYTAADLKNVKLRALAIGCTGFNETLECKITIDGYTISISAGGACTAAQWLELTHIRFSAPGTPTLLFAATAANVDFNYTDHIIEARSLKIEIRKTTAAGASAITCAGIYGQA